MEWISFQDFLKYSLYVYILIRKLLVGRDFLITSTIHTIGIIWTL